MCPGSRGPDLDVTFGYSYREGRTALSDPDPSLELNLEFAWDEDGVVTVVDGLAVEAALQHMLGAQLNPQCTTLGTTVTCREDRTDYFWKGGPLLVIEAFGVEHGQITALTLEGSEGISPVDLEPLLNDEPSWHSLVSNSSISLLKAGSGRILLSGSLRRGTGWRLPARRTMKYGSA
jgi:hypothetical protein